MRRPKWTAKLPFVGARVEKRWPGIEDVLAKTAVSINGQIYQDAWLETIEPSSEVFFMHRIEGG
ncbi:MAG: hypothetical protein Ct9H300mP8_10760 [Gammaproteobacteria bacterium]|nr:MAG: hypothetical protein Ct9H300mP8_10760 [Gammaproteobacteria bacterium]